MCLYIHRKYIEGHNNIIQDIISKATKGEKGLI